LRSPTPVKLGHLHKVTAKRYHRDGLLILDEEQGIALRSPGHLQTLNLEKEPLYIGGFPIGSDKALSKK
jgi:coxsackievirus/adenovirus receptor